MPYRKLFNNDNDNLSNKEKIIINPFNKEDKTICIYLASHVENYVYPDIEIYKAIQVGVSSHNDLHLPYKDNIGENISERNPYYCELTAYYWVWKNSTADIVGVGHYRRIPADNKNLFTKEQIKKILSEYDFITNGNINLSPPEKNYYKLLEKEDIDIPGDSTYNQYSKYHKRVDIDLAWYYIKEYYPEYEEDFVNQIVYGNLFIPCNILITSKEIFNDYCEWLFNILFFVEKYSPYKIYDDYNQRVFGFLSERLLAVYFYHNKLKGYTCSTIDLKENN